MVVDGDSCGSSTINNCDRIGWLVGDTWSNWVRVKMREGSRKRGEGEKERLEGVTTVGISQNQSV